MDVSMLAKRYLDEKKEAEASIEAMRRGNYATEEDLHQLLRRFVMSKYLLPQDEQAHELDVLAEKSVERTLAMSDGARVDFPATCEGTTSAINKKVLLLMAVQRELGVRFDVSETPLMRTTDDIAHALYGLLEGGRHGE